MIKRDNTKDVCVSIDPWPFCDRKSSTFCLEMDKGKAHGSSSMLRDTHEAKSFLYHT